MKSAVVHQKSDPSAHPCNIERLDLPQVQENEILVNLHANGCCHTDLHWPTKPNFPLIPGHEGIGEVVVKGDHVDEFEIGDRAGVAWLHSACGLCEYCIEGWETLCRQQSNTGYSVPGCMSEYATAVAKYAVKIPHELSNEQAAPILCAGVTVYKGIKETEARPGQFITIIGAAGGLGHLAIQYARAMGLRVIAVDVGAEKKQFCESLGAELAIDITANKDYATQVSEYTGGGSHAVLNLATHPSSYQSAVQLCRRKGCVVILGMADLVADLPIADVVLRRITVRGSIVGTRQDMREALDFAVRGQVTCQVTTAPLEEVNEVIDRLNKGQINGRVVLTM